MIAEQPLSKTAISPEQTGSELKKLLAGEPYDASVINALDSSTRQMIAGQLLAALSDRSLDQYEPARQAFLSHGYFDEVTRDLRTAGSPAERAAAATKLGTVGSPLATTPLVAALHDSAPEVRRSAVESLGQIGDPGAIQELNALLLRETSRQLPETLIRQAIESITLANGLTTVGKDAFPAAESQVLRANQRGPLQESSESRAFAETKSLKPKTNATPLSAPIPKSVMEGGFAIEQERLRLQDEALTKAAGDLGRHRLEAAATRKHAGEEARLEAVNAQRTRLDAEARVMAEEAAVRPEQEAAPLSVEEQARLDGERKNSVRTVTDAHLGAEEDERFRMEAETLRRAAEELARRRSEVEIARLSAGDEMRAPEDEVGQRLTEEASLLAGREKFEEEFRRPAEEEVRMRVEEVSRRLADEKFRRRAEEQRLQTEAEERRRIAEERLKLEQEALMQAAVELTRRRAEVDEARRAIEEEARLLAETQEQMRLENERRSLAEAERFRLETETQVRAQEERRVEQDKRIEVETRRRAKAEARLKDEEFRSQAGVAAGVRLEEEGRQIAEEARILAEKQGQHRRDVGEHLREEESRRLYKVEERLRMQQEAMQWAEETRLVAEQESRSPAADKQGGLEDELKSERIVEEIHLQADQDQQAPWFDVQIDGDGPEEIDREDKSFTARGAVVETHPPLRPTREAVDGPVVTQEKGLARFGEDSSIPFEIFKKLNSNESRERAAALAELAPIGGPDVFSFVSRAFDDESADVRNAAAHALHDMQPDRAASFTRALREGSPERRRRIGAALAASGLANNAINNLTGESREKTYDAFALLFLMARAGEVQPLMQAIEEHANVEVRLAVVKLLALSGQTEIVPAFRRLAVRGSLPSEIRSAVMEAIYQISSQARESARSLAGA